MMNPKVADLLKRKEELKAAKLNLEMQIARVGNEIEKIHLDAFPHKVGDVIDRFGRKVKIRRLNANDDGVVFAKVVEKIKHGWSKRDRLAVLNDNLD